MKGVKKEGMITEWKGNGMEENEGRETSEDGRGKRGKTVVIEVQMKRE